jgi:hypothetical protein
VRNASHRLARRRQVYVVDDVAFGDAVDGEVFALHVHMVQTFGAGAAFRGVVGRLVLREPQDERRMCGSTAGAVAGAALLVWDLERLPVNEVGSIAGWREGGCCAPTGG